MPITLDYVRPTPWHKKKSTRRALFFLFIASLLAVIFYFAPPTWRRIKILYYQDICMNHLDEPDAVVASLSLDNVPSGAPADDCKNYFDAIGPAARGTYMVTVPNPFPYTAGFTSSAPVPLSRDGRIFLHERTSKGGTRLITMDLDVVTDPPPLLVAGEPMSSVAFCVSVIKPGTLTRDPEFLSDDRCKIFLGGEVLPSQSPHPQALVIYAAQPDKKDAAAFSVQFLFYGRTHIAKFRLNETADKVEYISMGLLPSPDRF
jgi:hypothetical protein